jgi:ferredoxin-NADP reductase
MTRGSRFRVIVDQIIEETSKVKRFILIPANEQPLPAFGGGAHITTYLPCGDTELERHYSLVGDPRDRSSYQIAVRLHETSRGGSLFWHQVIQKGQQIEISYPKNHFPLGFRAKHHVFYAAGIGITPFLSMMADLQAKGESFELHYAARSDAECAFYRMIREQYPTQSRFYFSKNGERLSPDLLLTHRIGTHMYVCGPEQMIAQFTETARSYGYPPNSIHFERFTPQIPKQRHPFQVTLQKDGRTLEVPADQSVLDVLQKAGIKVRSSCRVGACGTCEIPVISGEIDHFDTFLTESERESNRTMLCCVSRARSSRLVLDL